MVGSLLQPRWRWGFLLHLDTIMCPICLFVPFAYHSLSSLLCCNMHMLRIRTQRRSSPRVKLIQSSADKAIPINNSIYPNIKWRMNSKYSIKNCLPSCISCNKVFKIGACGRPAAAHFWWWQKEERKNDQNYHWKVDWRIPHFGRTLLSIWGSFVPIRSVTTQTQVLPYPVLGYQPRG